MFKRILKKLLLFWKFKVKKVNSFTYNISLKTDIGKNSTIMNNSEIDAFSTVGKYTYIGKNCFITKTTIGNYCSIANNVSIGQGEHDLSKISTNSIFYENEYDKLTKEDCIIQNDVWIGVDTIILRGVTIGNGAVIGANSVVTKSIPAYAVAVGSPAKIIKYRFDKLKIQNIEQSKWWELGVDDAKKVMKNLGE